ncbi:polymer-forming cytoskeletal protein [Flavobacterium sp. Sd200]|uniref:bactofilin family protein n=1 Tax=Flavobacterium sp. Sd200 TaxID=2692211 RepID=UPI00136EE8EF|nr:polymer-forming cytoskeletal protein [Flavobacterium sp. Sd200]MXN92607.1 polymer-forming cytoskeletal protein [Flavobacterium sp. Sd200]
MFEKQKNQTDLLGKTNRIVEGTIIKGDITSHADLRLDGQLTGNLISHGRLVIGPTGSVIGDIKCKTADIEGHFNGRIEVEDLLSLKAKANITGDVITGKLAVEPGAIFTATCTMRNPGVKPLLSAVSEKQSG